MNLSRYQKIFRLCTVGRGYFSSISPCEYPYKFGGIAQKEQTQHPSHFVYHVFGNEVKEGFRIAYIAVLEALKNKDNNFLANIMQPTLIKKLKFLDVQLANSQAPLEVRIHKCKMTLGGQFIRNDKNRTVSQYANTSLAGIEGFMCEQGLRSGMMMGMKIPILFSFDIYFKGLTKLLKTNTQNSEKQQYHMLQFQLENIISFQQLMASVGEMQASKNNGQGFKNIMKKIIGNNYQWKIADMDESLQGNIVIKKGGFGGGFGGFGNLGGFLKK